MQGMDRRDCIKHMLTGLALSARRIVSTCTGKTNGREITRVASRFDCALRASFGLVSCDQIFCQILVQTCGELAHNETGLGNTRKLR